jgi:hypothetical protein
MNNSISKLVQGKIPVKTVCPFKDRCAFQAADQCNIKGGGENTKDFSCAVARAYDLIDRNSAPQGTEHASH